ncbi:McrB family protein [Arcobacter porcinus]|uniref:McrB family protein n=1 Tax=Arcobacter porcinus TaxID=1935204 RepID=UPI0008251764|nr:AAA family ATPase [Arcobacter porcinus]OCL86122.1 Type-2 restriction enzyme BsuMI component YdiS [Arcobacter porcinus]
MAKSYQANLDGSITEPNIHDDNKSYDIIQKFEEFLNNGTWTFTKIGSDNGSYLKYQLNSGNNSLNINIYLKKIGYRNRLLYEKGIQFGGNPPISQKIEEANNSNEIFVYIGMYKHYELDKYILVGWNPSEWSTTGSTFNCFIDVKYIAEAFLWGKAIDKSRKPKKIVAFKPEFLYDYLKNIDEYHNSENNSNNELYQEVEIPKNIIYFGSPGTGKSYAADNKTGANIEGRKEFVEKTTFHPEYDYNSFVGGYKPVMVKKDGENKIEYKFVPQIFTNIYIKAWNDLENHYFLQIEEINRGNCAEIFGDLFQLLDRDENGKSKYEITATEDLRIYLEENLKENGLDGIKGGKLRLSSNLSIVATMNTSDQSLFPMDSAFKRRWDWEYVPIEYDPAKTESDFIITLTSGSKYKWLDFLKEVNQRILKATHSQDKQLGNWFINAKNTNNIINEKTFINKVIFYLWNDVFKDEDETIFVKDRDFFTYEYFFTNNNNSELIEYIFTNNLNLKKIEDEVSTELEEV